MVRVEEIKKFNQQQKVVNEDEKDLRQESRTG